ncbi:MAG: hypothetical protein IJ496_09735 [Ruminococcus sp.]|nr:hypothetical protein [Ruminococcus sp.]
MKQTALHRFSAAALKGNTRPLQGPLMLLCTVYALHIALLLMGAWLLCTCSDLSLMWILLWCGGKLLLSVTTVLIALRCKAHLLLRCISLLRLPCGFLSAGYKRLLRLALWKGLIRFLIRLPAAVGFFAAGLLLQEAAAHTDSLYWLMGAAQVLPLTLGLLLLRLRAEVCFLAAEVLCVQQPEVSALSSLKTAFRLMLGQYAFFLRILLRSLPWMLLPGRAIRCIMTMISFFSVRHLEWRYHLTEGRDCGCEPAHLHRRFRKPRAAGELPAP